VADSALALKVGIFTSNIIHEIRRVIIRYDCN